MENELKYIYDGEDFDLLSCELVNKISEYGFVIIDNQIREQEDYYYDNSSYVMFQINETLRIREKNNTFKGTYKRIVDNSSEYLVREEIEVGLPSLDFNFFINMLNKKKIYFEGIFKNILVLKNKRNDVLLAKDGVILCLSFDNVNYLNQINGNVSQDKMVEIELKSGDGLVLLEDVNKFILQCFDCLTLIKDNKYKRGIIKTNPLLNVSKTRRL